MAISSCADANEVLTSVPCLNCMSEVELWSILALLLSVGAGKTEDEMIAGAAKYRNLSDLEFLRGLISVLPYEYLPWNNVDVAIKRIRQRGQQEVKAMLLWAMCAWLGNPD